MGITRQIQRYLSLLLAIALFASIFAVTGMQKANAELSSSPIADFPQVTGTVYAIETASDGSVYVGGNFYSIGGVSRTGLARILPDNTVDPNFNTNILPEVGDDLVEVRALALSEDEQMLYVGGTFGRINSDTTRNNIASVSTETATATAFNPNTNGTVHTIELNEDDELVYVGGGFSAVNEDVVRTDLAAFNDSTGAVTAFDAEISNFACISKTVYDLDYNSDTGELYVAGHYGRFGETNRRGLALVDPITGALDNTFNPNFTSDEQQCAYVYSIARVGDVIYAGGYFDAVNGGAADRTNFAAVDSATGIATNMNIPVNGTVFSLLHDPAQNSLFIGGGFSVVNAITRNELAEINLATNQVTDFNPNITTEETPLTVHALALSANGTLYAGGSFDQVGGSARTGLAAFLNPDSDNDGISSETENTAPNSGDGNNDGTPDAEQSHVTSLLNEDTNEYVTIVAPSGTTISTTTAEAAPTEDGFTHLFGLTGFTVSGVTPGDTIPIEIFYPNPDNLDPTTLIPKKYFPSTQTYQDLEGASVTSETIDTQPTLKLSYSLTDGGTYDLDGTTNGQIADPVSLATSDAGALADTGSSTRLSLLVATILMTAGLYKARKVYI